MSSSPNIIRDRIEDLFGPVYWLNDSPWLVRNRVLSPLFLPHALPEFRDDELRNTLSESGALVAWWVDQWDREQGEWYWICCDIKDYNEQSVRKSHYRKYLRKGARMGRVSKIRPLEHSEVLYEIISKAIDSYDNSEQELESFESYQATLKLKDDSGDYEFWAYFSEDKLVSYSECLLMNDAVRLVSGKSDYSYRKLKPNNSLYFQLTEHYLNERKVKYLTNGQKTINHPSNINTLFENLGYRRVYCRPRLVFSNKIQTLAKGLSHPVGRVLAKSLPLPKHIASKIRSLQDIVDIEKANRT